MRQQPLRLIRMRAFASAAGRATLADGRVLLSRQLASRLSTKVHAKSGNLDRSV
jgi:hypothetical protein